MIQRIAGKDQKRLTVDRLLLESSTDQKIVAALNATHSIAEYTIGQTDFAEFFFVGAVENVLQIFGEGFDAQLSLVLEIAVVYDQRGGERSFIFQLFVKERSDFGLPLVLRQDLVADQWTSAKRRCN